MRKRVPLVLRWILGLSLLAGGFLAAGATSALAQAEALTRHTAPVVHASATPTATASVTPTSTPTPTPLPTPTHPDGPVTVVGLGDSVESCYACGCTSFVTTAAEQIAATQQRQAVVHNEAFAGATSGDVLDQLADEGVQADIKASDLVIINIGANDFDESLAYDPSCTPAATSDCFADERASMTANLTRIVTEVKALQTGPGAQVIVLGYWNVFRDGDVGRAQGPTYVKVSAELTQWLNAATQEIAAQNDIWYADAATPFLGSDGSRDATPDLVSDGDHPNAAGHALLAQAVVNALGPAVATV